MAGVKGKSGRKPGTQKTGGRVKGTPNKATADVKALAQLHGPAAIAEAVRIMQESDSDQARMAAIKEILDRAYGKSTQPIAGDDTADPIRQIMRVELIAPGYVHSSN